MGIFSRIKKNSINDITSKLKSRRTKKKYLADREKLIADYLSKNEIAKLQIGCGPCSIEGWLNSDLEPLNDKVIYLDAGEKFPFKNESINYVYCEHLFEHLDFAQSVNFIKESYRVLKVGGVLRISTPNLNSIFKLANESSELSKKYIAHSIERHWNLLPVKNELKPSEYNAVYVISNFFKDWGHQIIHNESSLKSLLGKYNFKTVEVANIGQSNFAELQNIEQHMKQIGEEFNAFETIIVEAVK